MISSFWNNIAQSDPMIVTSGMTDGLHRAIHLRNVLNRGDLQGLIIETLTKVAAPGASKNLRVYYAFSMKENRDPAQLLTAATYQDLALDSGGVGTRRSYSLPINYMGGDYLHIWFTADAFSPITSQQELDVT